MGLPKRLTDKQIKFANLIVSEEGRKTATECAIEAGYDSNSAYVSASKLQNPTLYPLVSQYIGRLKSEKIKTAATDGKDIFFNEQFLKSLNSSEQNALMLHEVLHMALLHVTRRQSRDPHIWNIAALLIMFFILNSSSFGSNGLLI